MNQCEHIGGQVSGSGKCMLCLVQKEMQWVPIEVDDIAVGMGARSMEGILPPYKDIPEEFKQSHGKWIDFVDDWFFKGIELKEVVMKEGIDKKKAFRHLQSIMHSWSPGHEHKTAGVAYLASLWFEKVDYVAGK
jgi:hypothetical protein